MIVETIPVLEKLSAREKRILASELWDETSEISSSPDPEVIALLDQRAAHFLANPDSALDWDAFKSQLSRKH